MSKPIGSEWSVMLISRLFLLNFLLLWQLGTGTTTFDDSIEEVVRNGSLPDYEVGFNKFFSSVFQTLCSKCSNLLTLTHPICSTEPYSEIKCSCQNQSVCSVTIMYKIAKQKLGWIITPHIFLFSVLKLLYLFNNQLSGGIPFRRWGIYSISTICMNLASNSLTGSIPPSLTKLHNLIYLFLSNNDLDGTIPQNLTGLQSLWILDLSNNQLTGPIPDSIRFCQNLIEIHLRLNFLSGTINENLGKLSLLTLLDLYSNKLSGIIPKELGKLSLLIYLNLDDNDLHGELPKELGNLTNLRQLAVGGNYLSGPIPDYIGKWVNLTTGPEKLQN
ncbi:hypothetical protein POTOM_052231 [Populus tomentosa]|uniref:Uncharacterized protein n=1 Tax=Populus tomentosa TaxID=118781 RepID=A0A8X7Y5Y7_POPTO|nr:hypothetical protein POTOM_052231 [Populus tomentosa]